MEELNNSKGNSYLVIPYLYIHDLFLDFILGTIAVDVMEVSEVHLLHCVPVPVETHSPPRLLVTYGNNKCRISSNIRISLENGFSTWQGCFRLLLPVIEFI